MSITTGTRTHDYAFGMRVLPHPNPSLRTAKVYVSLFLYNVDLKPLFSPTSPLIFHKVTRVNDLKSRHGIT
jgi:hypothetical protein